MTVQAWTETWYWWLLLVFVSWLVLEGYSIYAARRAKQQFVMTWTLSETIRRWSGRYRWLSPVAIGTACFLLAHFFLEGNPP